MKYKTYYTLGITLLLIALYTSTTFASPTTNIVSYYTMNLSANDTLGLMNFSSIGSPFITKGLINGSVNISTGNYYNTTDRVLFGKNNFSVSVWINTTQGSGGDRGIILGTSNVYNSPNGFLVATDQANTLDFLIDDGSGLTRATCQKSVCTWDNAAWHHIAATRNSTTLNLYWDGNLVNSTNYATIKNATNQNSCNTFSVGTAARTSTPCDLNEYNFKGKIDELGLWKNYVLSLSEVQQLYYNDQGTTYPFYSIIPTLNYPTNGSVITSSSINFNSSAVSTFNITNATIYIYNSTATINTTTNNTITGLTNTTIFSISGLQIGTYNWNVLWCGNNTEAIICSYANNNTFTIGASIETVSYNTTVLLSSTQGLAVNGTKPSWITSVSGRMSYNGTYYTSTATTTGNTFTLSNTISASPTGTNNLFWELTMSNGTSTYYQNTSVYTQTVGNLTIYYCNTTIGLSGLALNFSTYIEQSEQPINASFEATISYYAYGGTGTINQTLDYQSINESKNNWMFCINSSGLNATVNAFTSFYTDGYDRREYIISDGIVGNFTQNIPLFLALTSETDVVTVIIKDQNYNPIQNALVAIQKWDIGTNTFSTVGMFYTNNEGQGIINLELYNAWYRAVISVNGVTVQVTEPEKLASTTWNIPVILEVNNPYELFGSISKSLTFDNSTNITTYTWLDSSGYTQQGCLQIRNLTTLGYETISLECTTSVSATINYQLPATGEYEITGTIYLLPIYNISELTNTLFIRLGTPTITEKVSPFGKVLSFIFIGTAAGVGISAGSPIWGAILLIGSIFLSAKLGWLNITQGIIWGLLSIVIVILFRLSKKQ